MPISIGPGSFVLADKLAYCRFSFRDPRTAAANSGLGAALGETFYPTPFASRWRPLAPDPAVCNLYVDLPVHVTRLPLEPYDNNN